MNMQRAFRDIFLIPLRAVGVLLVYIAGLFYVIDPLFADANHCNKSGFGTPSAIRLLTGGSFEPVSDGFLPGSHFPLTVKPRYCVLKTDADVAANAVHVDALTDSLKPLDVAREKEFGLTLEELNGTLLPALHFDLNEAHASWLYTGHSDFENVPVFFYPERHIVVYFLDSLRRRGRYLRDDLYRDDPAVY